MESWSHAKVYSVKKRLAFLYTLQSTETNTVNVRKYVCTVEKGGETDIIAVRCLLELTQAFI